MALRAFLKANPEWSVIYHTQVNHGLTVISRDKADKPALPGRITMAANLARAVGARVADGLPCFIPSDLLLIDTCQTAASVVAVRREPSGKDPRDA